LFVFWAKSEVNGPLPSMGFVARCWAVWAYL